MKASFLNAYVQWIRKILPSPLAIAIALTILSYLAVSFWGDKSAGQGLKDALLWWSNGLWKPELLTFAVQMMLMLVLGHVVALSPPVSKLINLMIAPLTNTAKAAAFVALASMLMALLNWGLGLIFGAIMARRIAENAQAENRQIHFPLIGAAGYASMLIWHGGISGSALIKSAEPGHLRSLASETYSSALPEALDLGQTVFSTLNIATCFALLVLVPILFYTIGNKLPQSVPNLSVQKSNSSEKQMVLMGAEHLDQKWWPAAMSGGLVLLACVLMASFSGNLAAFFTPNHINLMLLGVALISHQNLNAFTLASEEAIKGASAILIQFPLYFGILALMEESGFVRAMADLFAQYASAYTFPLLTFLSAGMINIFIPSGGGQWAIQGPVIVQASIDLGVPLHKGILAMAYGDQLTNMLQPFWALPLLGITKLQARDILPYTLLLFCAGAVVFITGLLF